MWQAAVWCGRRPCGVDGCAGMWMAQAIWGASICHHTTRQHQGAAEPYQAPPPPQSTRPERSPARVPAAHASLIQRPWALPPPHPRRWRCAGVREHRRPVLGWHSARVPPLPAAQNSTCRKCGRLTALPLRRRCCCHRRWGGSRRGRGAAPVSGRAPPATPPATPAARSGSCWTTHARRRASWPA